MIIDKVNNFNNLQRKVHLTKTPSVKYPGGKFYNGMIGQVYNDKILFDDDKEGMVEIYFFEIADIELFRGVG